MNTGAAPPAHEQVAHRAEFVRAFIEHAGPRPDSERLTVRWPTLMTIAGLSLVLALVVGVFTGLIHSQNQAAGGSAAKVVYTAVDGWGCVATGDHGFEATGRTADWKTLSSGGWSSDGCHGTFGTMPVSGKADVDDPKQYGTWHFTPGANVRCDVSAFVPKAEPPESAPALTSTATYTILGGDDAVEGTFAVDQRSNPGTWVGGGSVATKDRLMSVRLTNRGSPPTDRVGITQLKVSCSA